MVDVDFVWPVGAVVGVTPGGDEYGLRCCEGSRKRQIPERRLCRRMPGGPARRLAAAAPGIPEVPACCAGRVRCYILHLRQSNP